VVEPPTPPVAGSTLAASEPLGIAPPSVSLLDYLNDLHEAVMGRDRGRVMSLLNQRSADRLPREVREEAIAVSREDPRSLRAPMQMLRFFHMQQKLAEYGEATDLPSDQLALHLGRR
jgi:hypothetical protein